MKLGKISKVYSNYPNATILVKTLEGNVARLYADDQGNGVVSNTGQTSLSSSGSLDVYVDPSKTYSLQVYYQTELIDVSTNIKPTTTVSLSTGDNISPRIIQALQYSQQKPWSLLSQRPYIIPVTWSNNTGAGTTYYSGQWVKANGYYWSAIQGGLGATTGTGPAAPTADTSSIFPVLDGTIIWVCMGPDPGYTTDVNAPTVGYVNGNTNNAPSGLAPRLTLLHSAITESQSYSVFGSNITVPRFGFILQAGQVTLPPGVPSNTIQAADASDGLGHSGVNVSFGFETDAPYFAFNDQGAPNAGVNTYITQVHMWVDEGDGWRPIQYGGIFNTGQYVANPLGFIVDWRTVGGRKNRRYVVIVSQGSGLQGIRTTPADQIRPLTVENPLKIGYYGDSTVAGNTYCNSYINIANLMGWKLGCFDVGNFGQGGCRFSADNPGVGYALAAPQRILDITNFFKSKTGLLIVHCTNNDVSFTSAVRKAAWYNFLTSVLNACPNLYIVAAGCLLYNNQEVSTSMQAWEADYFSVVDSVASSRVFKIPNITASNYKLQSYLPPRPSQYAANNGTPNPGVSGVFAITKANPMVVSVTGYNLNSAGNPYQIFVGDHLKFHVPASLGMIELNNKVSSVVSMSSRTVNGQIVVDITTDLDSTSYTTFVPGSYGSQIMFINELYTSPDGLHPSYWGWVHAVEWVVDRLKAQLLT